ncbi:MAG: colicin E3/pyocin S6 family cytotoxin [Bacteroidota bacterium]
MNTRNVKLTNCYTQGQRSAARILFIVWLLTSYSPDITLAAPEGGRAMASATATSSLDRSAPGALTLPPAIGPALESTLQQRMSQEAVPYQRRDLRRTSIEASPVGRNLSFQARGGEQVRFYYERDQWRAEVSSRIGASSRQSLLPVVCSLGEDVASSLEVLSQYPSWQSQRQIHVLGGKVLPTLGEVVYVGELGLKGGGNNVSFSFEIGGGSSGYDSWSERDWRYYMLHASDEQFERTWNSNMAPRGIGSGHRPPDSWTGINRGSHFTPAFTSGPSSIGGGSSVLGGSTPPTATNSLFSGVPGSSDLGGTPSIGGRSSGFRGSTPPTAANSLLSGGGSSDLGATPAAARALAPIVGEHPVQVANTLLAAHDLLSGAPGGSDLRGPSSIGGRSSGFRGSTPPTAANSLFSGGGSSDLGATLAAARALAPIVGEHPVQVANTLLAAHDLLSGAPGSSDLRATPAADRASSPTEDARSLDPMNIAFQREVIRTRLECIADGRDPDPERPSATDPSIQPLISPHPGLTIQLPDRDALQKEIDQHIQACQEDSLFNDLQTELSTTKASLQENPDNKELQSRYQETLVNFQSHPFYQRGLQLGIEAVALREKSEKQSAACSLSALGAAEQGIYDKKAHQAAQQHQEAAATIKKSMLQPLRATLGRSDTPSGTRRAVASIQGFGESIHDTGKAILGLVDLAVKGIESFVKWEDKVGFQEGYVNLKQFWEALSDQRQQAWESSEEYQARMQAVKEVERREDLRCRFADAEHYHLSQGRMVGRMGGELAQLLYGAEIVKVVSKGAQGLGWVAKAGQTVEQLGEAAATAQKGEAAAGRQQSLLGGVRFIPSLQSLPAFPDAVKVRGKTRIPGYHKIRGRYENRRHIYEWDYQHGSVERYSKKTGRHLGEFCPHTGEQLKPVKATRKIER